jgi:hypothetical protein
VLGCRDGAIAVSERSEIDSIPSEVSGSRGQCTIQQSHTSQWSHTVQGTVRYPYS